MSPVNFKPLTPREREVMRLISLGLDCRAIALQLHISPLTVRKHRSNIMAKKGLTHSAQLCAFAVERDFRRTSAESDHG
ncbi:MULTISPECIES: response regulator transcription factor [unclassified Pseudomonas]|uniref:response regulator transcription factor n=1 Tax=unclassified Pseudomonas TaxID=196821 RepID=UPI0034DD9B23